MKRYIDSEVFNALVMLYRHKNSAFNLLTRVRLNPDFNSSNQPRSDLEFFIPQLCAFYLNNELDEFEENQIRDILLRACEIDFFFAHRVWFYFRANIDYIEDFEQRKKIE